MKSLLKNNLFFFVPYITFLAICIFFKITHEKAELHILLNKANSLFFDHFFRIATYLGDGAMIAVLTIILLFVKYRYSLVILTGGLITSVVVQLLKKVILGEIFRPSKYFELFETYQLHFVEGVKLHSLYSFPSGHSATAFNVFFMLALIVRNKVLKTLSIVAAIVVAYSRVYLSQHFLIDIVVGSVTGIFLILVVFWWSEFWNKKSLEKSLTDKFKL